MKEKRKRGQLVRLVDLFGFFIGDFLLDVSPGIVDIYIPIKHLLGVKT